mmetsp:Transcript_77486/g.250796  ORF Transcript_77486/g.250796 Transcript_77486/m.250796 type:complete len:247 (+) Transcript_77486:636-1376(+)
MLPWRSESSLPHLGSAGTLLARRIAASRRSRWLSIMATMGCAFFRLIWTGGSLRTASNPSTCAFSAARSRPLAARSERKRLPRSSAAKANSQSKPSSFATASGSTTNTRSRGEEEPRLEAPPWAPASPSRSVAREPSKEVAVRWASAKRLPRARPTTGAMRWPDFGVGSESSKKAAIVGPRSSSSSLRRTVASSSSSSCASTLPQREGNTFDLELALYKSMVASAAPPRRVCSFLEVAGTDTLRPF